MVVYARRKTDQSPSAKQTQQVKGMFSVLLMPMHTFGVFFYCNQLVVLVPD